MTMWQLYIGQRFSGISVRPDEQWPGMWRIHHGNRVYDMLNLTRAKDAAVSWAHPGGNQAINWHCRQTPVEGATAA